MHRYRLLASLGGCVITLAAVTGCQPGAPSAPTPSASTMVVSSPDSSRPSSAPGDTVPPSVSPSGAAQPGATADYAFKPLVIGGGGFVTGAAFSADPAIRYVRTDVGGAYRWNARTSTWTQILTASAVPGATEADYKVESIAAAPSNPKLVVVAAGGDSMDVAASAGTGRILVSSNGGTRFKASAQRFWMSGNAEGRQGSERLAVDPADPRHVLFGTRRQGLWTSRDSGITWSHADTVPDGTDGTGVQFVRWDGARVYASVAGQGIYRSDDRGAHWRQVLAAEDVGFSISIAGDHTVYVGFLNSVRRYDPAADSWRTITPGGGYAWQVAVSPQDPALLFASTEGMSSGNVYRSRDGGTTWKAMNIDVSAAAIPWVAATDEKNYFSIAAMFFDPTRPSRLWLAQGTGIWRADDLNADTLVWTNASDGIEEAVATDVIAPPGDAPVTTIFDRQGFYHSSLDQPPAKPLVDEVFWGGTGLDYSGQAPRNLVTVQAKNNYYPALVGRAAYSSDGGRTWTVFPSTPVPSIGPGGNIAVSATNPDNVVWLPSTGDFGKGKTPYYTTDRGKTWSTSTGITSVNTHWYFWWGTKRALESDKVRGDTFYLTTFDNGGAFSVSTDGGRTFQPAANSPACTQPNDCHVYGQVHAAPGHAGNVWSSAGKDGLWFTTDAGATAWTKVSGVQEARSFGFGAPLTKGGYPAIYLNGKANGDPISGVWRSGDRGATWTKVSSAPAGLYGQINTVSGDMNHRGRVYVGFTGNGFLYGQDRTYETHQ